MKKTIFFLAFIAISFAGFAQTNSFPSSGNAVLNGSSLDFVNDFGDASWTEGAFFRPSNSDEGNVAGFGLRYEGFSDSSTLFMAHGNDPANSDLGIYILQNGKTGIGTKEIPTEYLLAVGGKMIAEGLRVELMESWPDYVFSEDYKRLSIAELDRYIKENGHLPNIPSAKKVEEEGIDVGEMQTKQMEKIEELALYIIDLKKEIDLLKAKIENHEN